MEPPQTPVCWRIIAIAGRRRSGRNSPAACDHFKRQSFDDALKLGHIRRRVARLQSLDGWPHPMVFHNIGCRGNCQFGRQSYPFRTRGRSGRTGWCCMLTYLPNVPRAAGRRIQVIMECSGTCRMVFDDKLPCKTMNPSTSPQLLHFDNRVGAINLHL